MPKVIVMVALRSLIPAEPADLIHLNRGATLQQSYYLGLRGIATRR